MTAFDKINTLNWTHLELREPVAFRDENNRMFVIRQLRNHRGVIMARLEMDEDNMMRRFDQLPEAVQQQITNQLEKK
jgi:hypothetical protein